MRASGLAEPVRVLYGAPAGWAVEQLASDTSWTVLEQRGDSVTLVPLALDTIALPPLRAWSGADTVVLQPPLLVVDRTMPDTLYTVTMFPAPAPMQIPPGLPEDYLSAHRFWLLWMEPGKSLLVPVAAAVAAAAAAAAFLLYRRRRRKPPVDEVRAEAGPRLPGEILALIDSPAMASGDWKALYREIDRLLRLLVESRFAVDTHALTYRQMGREMKDRPDWKRFTEDFGAVIREITLQRYAGWGTTRDAATALVRSMADAAGKWLR